MDITFYCYRCGQHLEIDEAGEGTNIQCPKCGQNLRVPNTNSAPRTDDRLVELFNRSEITLPVEARDDGVGNLWIIDADDKAIATMLEDGERGNLWAELIVEFLNGFQQA
jgi:DNA-directed RNA polymerase subunit RPC12/RpoP